jgi:hypothetical protein
MTEIIIPSMDEGAALLPPDTACVTTDSLETGASDFIPALSRQRGQRPSGEPSVIGVPH